MGEVVGRRGYDPATVRTYWELGKAGFRRASRYRTAIVASVFTNTIFGLVRASFLLTAIRLAGQPIGGYDALQAATYVWLGQALLGPVDVWGAQVDVGDRIKSGDIAVDLLRPTSILGAQLAQNYGRAAFELLPRGVPPLIIGALITGLHVPHGILPYLLGALSIVLATAMCRCYYYAVGLSALWTTENRGFVVIAMVVQQVLSGFVVPVSWFPGWLRAIADASPFPGMMQVPIDMLTERTSGLAALGALGIQAAWTAGLVGLCLGLLHLGRRKVVIQGG